MIRNVDQLLRGGFTRDEDLRLGRIPIPVRVLGWSCLVMGASYGLMMGLYAATGESGSAMQVLASAVKVPLLFLLTLVVTFPSLYVFSALSNSRLRAADTGRLLLAAVAVDMAVLASFGPVTAFFTFSTSSYSFMILLNVAFFGLAGLFGLAFLRRTLETILKHPEPLPQPKKKAKGKTKAAEGGELDPVMVEHTPAVVGDSARRVFRAWLVIYGAVGAQMGWILRPFIGSPHMQFEWFRARESHFLEAVWRTLGNLFS